MGGIDVIQELNKIIDSNKELAYVEVELLEYAVTVINSLSNNNKFLSIKYEDLLKENKKLTEQIDRIVYNENKVNDIKSFLKLNLDDIVYGDLRVLIGNRVNEIKIGTKGGEK